MFMFKRPIPRSALPAVLAVVVLVFLLHLADTRALVRDVTPFVEKRVADLLGNQSGQGAPSITTSVTAWRSFPLLGSPTAKATVSLSLKNAKGRAIEQTLDFYFIRDDGTWIDSGCEDGHSAAEHGEAGHHHAH